MEEREERRDGPAAAGGAGATLDPDDWQDVRIAVVMNGGVSLAVWMGGVALELLNSRARIDILAETSAGGQHFAGMGAIGKLRIANEAGTDLFARTASSAAAVAAAALRTHKRRRLAVRFVVALVLVSVLAGIGMARGGVKDAGATLVRLLAVIGIVVLGWWIGGVRSPGPPASGPGVARLPSRLRGQQ